MLYVMVLVCVKIQNARLWIHVQLMNSKRLSMEFMEINIMVLKAKLPLGNGLSIYLQNVLEINISLLLILITTLFLTSVHLEDIIGEELTAISSMLRFTQEERKGNLVLGIMIVMPYMVKIKKALI